MARTLHGSSRGDRLLCELWLLHQRRCISHMHGIDEQTALSVRMRVAQDDVGVEDDWSSC